MPRTAPRVVGSFYDNWKRTTRTYRDEATMLQDIKNILYVVGPSGISDVQTRNYSLRKKVNNLITGENEE